MSARLSVRDLHVRYSGDSRPQMRKDIGRKGDIRAVDGVSFDVAAGEFVALVGESGCGKTTTAMALTSLVGSASGEVLIDGQDVGGLGRRAMRKARRQIQMVFQDPYESLDPRFRVRDTVTEPLRVHAIGRSSADRLALAAAALERVGLKPAEDFLDRYPHQLSGGQRQRVAIAAAIVLEPEVIVADEPVSMLDVSARAGVLEVLEGLRRDGLSVVMITHDLGTAALYTDRILVMYLGRIVETGPARAVVTRPRHPYTRALLGAVPRSDPRRRGELTALAGETPSAANIPDGCRFRSRCPLAIDACASVDPELVPVGRDHRAACIVAVAEAETSGTVAPAAGA